MPAAGLQIVTPGRTRYAGYRKLPVSGCLYWGYFGQSLDQSISNDVKDGQNGLVIGDPGVSDEFISTAGGMNYLQLPFTDLSAMTYIVVAKSTDTNADNSHRPTLIGCDDGTNNASGIYVSAATGVRLDVGIDEGSGAARLSSVVVTTPTEWHCYAGAFDAVDRTLYDLTAGIFDTDAFAGGATRALGSSRIRVGGGPGAVRAGTADILHSSVWSRKLSQAEIELLYESEIKPWAAAGGITI